MVRTCPPVWPEASSTVTSWPRFISSYAQHRPAMPPPAIITFFGRRVWGRANTAPGPATLAAIAAPASFKTSRRRIGPMIETPFHPSRSRSGAAMLVAFRPAVNPLQPIRNRRGVLHALERRRERGAGRPPRAHTLLPASNLREGCGHQEQVRNIRNDFHIGVARSCAELLPLRVGDKHCPVLVALLKVGKGQHVSQVRQPCPDQRLAEEDGPEAGAAENGDLSLIEHFDFFLVRLPAVTFVDAQLEDARLVGCGSRW